MTFFKLACFPPHKATTRGFADYSMYSTFLTASPGSVLFSRSNLLKRKDLCFSYLSLGLARHRRSLRSSHLSSQVCHDSHRVTLEKETEDRPRLGSYDQKWIKFETFTTQVQDDAGVPRMSALPASSQTVLALPASSQTVFLLESDTISVKSLQPYLSAINSVHNVFE